jgi:hypothetical protein
MLGTGRPGSWCGPGGLSRQQADRLVVMVLIGAGPDDSLRAFSEAESVQIVEMPEADVLQIAATVDEDDLREMAGRYRGLGVSAGAAMTPDSEAGAPGGHP